MIESSAASLRRLCVSHAMTFGALLLERVRGGAVPFREFVAVARELIAATPEHAAVYLAALVALDMEREEAQAAAAQPPSPN